MMSRKFTLLFPTILSANFLENPRLAQFHWSFVTVFAESTLICIQLHVPIHLFFTGYCHKTVHQL